MTPASASQCVVREVPTKGEETPGSAKAEAAAEEVDAEGGGATATSTYISAALFQKAPTVLGASPPSKETALPFFDALLFAAAAAAASAALPEAAAAAVPAGE